MCRSSLIYVGGFELPDKNAAAQRVVSNAKIFRELGYDVVFIETNVKQSKVIVHHQNCFGFDRWSIQSSLKRLISISNIIQILSDLSTPAAIIAYNFPAIALVELNKYCNRHAIKLIADVTEWYGAQGDNIVFKAIKGLDSYLRMNLIHPKLKGIIAISQYLEDYYKSKVPTLLLPPLTDLSEDKWNISASQCNLLRIIYAGSPGRNKDKLNIILQSLSKSNAEFEFRVIGLTKAQFLDNYPEEANTISKLNRRVIFLGRMSHRDVIYELKQSDFSLFFRDINRVTMAGFPTKFAEAITCGTPVLTNKTSDLEKYLTVGVNGFWIDDIDVDIVELLNRECQYLKSIKTTVDNKIFDYHNYIHTVDMWLDNILS